MKNFKVKEGVYVPDMDLTYDEKDPYVRMYKPTYDRAKWTSIILLWIIV